VTNASIGQMPLFPMTVKTSHSHSLNRRSKSPVSEPVTALDFIRLYLQHVLPSGFQKTRYYGLLGSANRKTIRELRLLILSSRFAFNLSAMFEFSLSMNFFLIEKIRILKKKTCKLKKNYYSNSISVLYRRD